MARLTNNQLIQCLIAYTSDTDNPTVEGISQNQLSNVFAAIDGDTTTPIYMQAFASLVNEYSFDTNEITIVLNSLQDDSNKPLSAGDMQPKQPEIAKNRKFVFTSAQNNTDVHTKFFKALKSYCEHNQAELLIGQFVYNKNGFQNGVTDDTKLYYAPELSPYLSGVQLKLCDSLTWCGELNILPTAKNPLNGFESLTGTSSTIIPHAKIALESIATLKNQDAKKMYTTGAVTLHNYIQKKAGQIAQHEHCYGALVVEIDESGNWFCRQIQTDESGIFQDLITVYYPNKKPTENHGISVINWGDLHSEKSDNAVLNCCQSMLNYLQPDAQIFNDTFDFTARNHHNIKSGHFLAEMHYRGLESVKGDCEQANSVLDMFYRDWCHSYIIESNHDLALNGWLDSDYNFKYDAINALTYLELQFQIYKNMSLNESFNVLEYALTDLIDLTLENTTFLNVDDSLILSGIENAIHGHIGANGSRGNPNQFRKLNIPINTGHTHACSIKGQVYTAGVTGSLDMGYNKGASSWSHSHILTYSTGFRTIITMQNIDGIYQYKA